jgi:hypothetical protein
MGISPVKVLGINRRIFNMQKRYVLLCSRKFFSVIIHSLITFFPETDSGIGEQKANPHWVDQEANHLSLLFEYFVLQVLSNLFGLTSNLLGLNFLVSSFIRLNLSSYNWRRLWEELSYRIIVRQLARFARNVWSTISVATPTFGGGGGCEFIQSLFWNVI